MDFAQLRARAETAASTSRAVPPPPAHAPPARSPAAPKATGDKYDKEALFGALDEFFATRLSLRPEPASPPTEPKVVSTPAYEPPLALPVQSASKPAPPPRSRKPPQAQRKPSSVARATRPGLAASQTRSYPPIESHLSAALSLLHWLLDPPDLTPHVSPGSTSIPFFLPPPASPSPVPPPLVHRDDVRSSFSWRQRSDGQTTYLAAFLFGDASIAWIRLEWHASSERSGTVGRDVRREGRYRPRPQVEREWDGARLYAASERYGPRIVRFAEEALSGRRPIARGECWDLANEALKACEEEEEEGRRTGGQVPFPSLARTHGALIYYADARGAGTGAPVVGEWTGGDLYVRPGDIVEWRSVTIREVGMRPGSYSTLGDPEHTALILSAGTPLAPPSIGASPPYKDPAYPLASLHSLTVVEQSAGRVPSQATYDLAAMSAGEVWIYRPCGLRDLCGVEELSAQWPEEKGIEAWALGELDE
ncbi:hypothetical protein JCM8202v2_004090 [Rhodotorula sphaerocarpa]